MNGQIDFNLPITVTNTGTIRVDANYKDLYYVRFIYNDKVIFTKEVDHGEVTSAGGIGLVITESGHVLKHFSLTPAGSAFDFNTPITEDIKLYAVLEEKHEVTFNSDGGTQVFPRFYDTNQVFGNVDTPTRTGYTFGGWYTQPNGQGTEIKNSTQISQDYNLHAKWVGKQVSYSIVYWQENANDTDYTYKETVNRTATAGSTITVAQSDRSSNRYQYFGNPTYDSGVMVKGDGTSIVNVYYKRNVYEVRFNLNRTNSKMTIGGVTYNYSTNANQQYKFSAKYNQDISDKWPTADNVPRVGSYYFRGWETSGTSGYLVSKRMDLTPELINENGSTKVFTGNWITSPTTYYLRYMIESLNGAVGDGSGGEIRSYNGKHYQEDLTYSQTAYTGSGTWSAKQIKGVTIVNSSAQSSGSYRYFYYTRNSYDLVFHNPNKIQSTSYLYGTDISGKTFNPPRPEGMPSDYTFAGWYTTPDGVEGSKYNFTGKTMPEHNLSLYAKWVAPDRTVQYYDKPGGTLHDVVIPNKTSINTGQLTEKIDIDGTFIGWYWYPDTQTFVIYDFNLEVERDGIILHPVWDGHDLSITYDANGGNGTVIDINKYKAGAGAITKDASNLTHPSDHVFVSWNTKSDGTGDNFYPHDVVGMTSDITLYAQWKPKSQKTSIIYDGNGGLDSSNDTQITHVLFNNESHTIKENPFTKDQYEFVEWNTKADGTGTSFAPQEVVIVDKENEPNILYAIWKLKTVNIIVRKTVTGNFSDDEELFNFTITINDDPEVFKLSHNQTTTITEIPITAVVLLEEDSGKYTPSATIKVDEGTEVPLLENGEGAYEIELAGNVIEINVINERTIDVDTGIVLDNLPYAFLLTSALGYGLYITIRRKKRI